MKYDTDESRKMVASTIAATFRFCNRSERHALASVMEQALLWGWRSSMTNEKYEAWKCRKAEEERRRKFNEEERSKIYNERVVNITGVMTTNIATL